MTPQIFQGDFQKKHSNASRTRKSYSSRSRAHLAVSTEQVWFQTRGGALGVNRVRLLLWDSLSSPGLKRLSHLIKYS